MLVLSRMRGEGITVFANPVVRIMLIDADRGKGRLGITTEPSTPIYRDEIVPSYLQTKMVIEQSEWPANLDNDAVIAEYEEAIIDRARVEARDGNARQAHQVVTILRDELIRRLCVATVAGK